MDTTNWTFGDWVAAIEADTPGIDRAIKHRNARMSIGIAQSVAANKHDAKGCRKKNCVHGAEEVVQGHIDHAARLTQEADAL